MAMPRFQKEDVGIRKSQADSVGQNSSKGICGMDGPDFEDRFEETSGKCLHSATGARRNRQNTSTSFRCSLGPGRTASFKHFPSCFAAASNTIRTFEVVLSLRMTGKCGRYH